MNKSIKKNYLYNVSYQIFSLLVPLITTPYISRVLNPEGIGIYSYTYSILRYFWVLSALGISTLGARTIGIKQDDKEERSICFWNIILLKIILSIIMIILYVGYVVLFSKNKFIAFIQGINLLAIMIDITWFFQGMEDFKSLSIKNFIIKIINVIYIFSFVKEYDDLWVYTFGIAFFQFLGNLSVWTHLLKYIEKVSIKKLQPFKYLLPGLKLFIPSIAVQIFAILDKSMIGWFTNNPKKNGYYEQAFKIVDMALMLITTMATIMIPRISREYANGNAEEIKKYINKSINFTMMLSIPMTLGLIIISDKFVPIFFGVEFSATIQILQVLSLLFILMGLNSVFGTQYLISIGQQDKYTTALLIGGTINIIFNIIFIPKFEALGAAISSVTGEFIILLIETSYIIKQKQLSIKSSLRNTIKYCIAGVCMSIVLLLLKHNIQNIVQIIIICGSGAIIYFGVLLLIKEENMCIELSKIKNGVIKNEKYSKKV